jgi:hypothetical protein
VAASLREEHDEGVARDKSLALEAMGTPHELQTNDQGTWTIVVADVDAARADDVLAAWEAENTPQLQAPARPPYGSSLVGAVAALAIRAALRRM